MTDESFDTKAQAEGKPPEGKRIHRRWMTELEMAGTGEKDWRKEAQDLLDIYRGRETKKNSYNILWANTEITRPALYNSAPHADVRRRFRDADPLGKAMSEVMKRALEYTIDVYDYHSVYKLAVLDMLLPGRGVMRLRYKPQMEGDAISWECVMPELVQWEDYRHGPGKTRKEVMWDAFRHRLTREELVAQFGEDVGNVIPLDAVDDKDEELRKLSDEDEIKHAFRTAEVWEIWDRDKKQCLFIAPAYKDKPAKVIDDPLGIDEFAPLPDPLMAIEDAASLIPIPQYRLYKEQAEELNRISGRINKIIQAVKFRGIYDATISEMNQLMEAGDNDFIPSTSTAKLIANGGIEKGIWTWPVNTIAQVLQYLYDARERTKSVIYELTGISDVVRGSTKASETLGAQQLKSQYAGVRLQKMQSAVQHFIRQSLNIAGGIIAEKFQPQTLMAMTGLQYPTEEQVKQQFAQAMMQWQMAAQMAQQQGQPPPPQPQPPQGVITWEAIISALRDNPTRSYKIDIETDSTIQATIESDMEGLGQVGQAINMTAGALMPLVEGGFMPPESLKEVIGAISRRARLGNAVEDALDKIGPPQQQGNPEEMQKAQQEVQQAQQEIQQKAQELQKREMELQLKETQFNLEKEAAQKQLQMVEASITEKVTNAQKTSEQTEALRAQEQSLALKDGLLQLQKAAAAIEGKLAAAESQAEAAGDQAKAAETQQAQVALSQTMQQVAQAFLTPKKITLEKDGMGRTVGAVSQPVAQQ